MTAAFAASQNFQGVAPLSLKAGAAITANRVVKLDSTEGQVIHSTAITDLPMGVALQTVASGEQVSVQTIGIAKCVAGAAIALGAEVMCTASGDGKVTTAAGATARSIGVAMQDASGDGAIVTVRIGGPGLKTPANS